MRDQVNNVYVVPEALKHDVVSDMTAMAVKNEESFIIFLRRLRLRDKDLREPKNSKNVIDPTIWAAGEVPVV